MARIIGNFEDLSASVQRATCRKVEDREEAAQCQVQQIKDDAHERADRIRREVLEEARLHAEEARCQYLAEATQKAQRKRLMAREEILDRVWTQGERELHELVDRDAYRQTLRQLARQAVQTLGPGHIVLAADPQGHDLLTEDRLTAWADEVSENFDTSVGSCAWGFCSRMPFTPSTPTAHRRNNSRC